MIQPWPLKATSMIGDYRIFQVRSDIKVSPRTGKEHEFFVIDCVNWVNVIAVTRDSELVMVEQYRHGRNSVELEVPGGMMDPGDPSPVEAGTRELREETGYEGDKAVVIGQIDPNPAIMSNVCHTLLVQDCECRHPTVFDHTEDLVTRLVPIVEIPKLIQEGAIRHSLVVVALYHFELWRKSQITPPAG